MLHRRDGVGGVLGGLRIDGQVAGAAVVQHNRDGIAREERVLLIFAAAFNKVIFSHLLAELGWQSLGGFSRRGLGRRTSLRLSLHFSLRANLAVGILRKMCHTVLPRLCFLQRLLRFGVENFFMIAF